MKANRKKQQCQDGFELLDVNQLITGGKDGFVAYRCREDLPEFGIFKDDLLFVDPNRKPVENNLIYTEEKTVTVAAKTKVVGGLYLASDNGRIFQPEIATNAIGVIVGITRKYL